MTGAGQLFWRFLHRDRWLMLGWSGAFVGLYWLQAVSVKGLYPTQAEFDAAAAAMADNAAFVAMAGPARALETVGGQVAWQGTAFGAISAGLMSMLIVVRHTRSEEDSGRDEMLRAAPIGRFATTLATIAVVVLANLAMGLLVAVSLLLVPLEVIDSVGLGVGQAAVGILFAAVALLAAQLTTSPRAAYGITGTVIGASYLVRAVGDVSASTLSWFSPIGWFQAMHAFSGLRWWPVGLLVVMALAVAAVALAIFDRRDYGSGVFATGRGAARATAALSSPFGLTWRLHRGPVMGWSLAMLLAGLAYGSLGRDVEALLGQSGTTQELLVRGSSDVVEGFYATSILVLALLCSGYCVSSALRARHDEVTGLVEMLLATGLSRSRWLANQVALTVLGTFVVLFSAGFGLGLGYALATGEFRMGVELLLATIPYLAPLLVLSSLARLLHAVVPTFANAAWLGPAYAVLIMVVARPLQLPQWLQDVSVFNHLALAPAEPFRWAPFLVLSAMAMVTSVAAQALFRRRDLGVR